MDYAQNDQKGQQAKLLTFKALNNLAPPYVSQLIVPYNPTRNLRSAGKHLSRSVDVFISRLKTYLFRLAFN